MTKAAKSPRSAGILLHPTSLPSPYGVGDLGPTAYTWVDALEHARQTYWQILPLGPTAYGDSPYQCFSAFAGNPSLISPLQLIEDGLIDTKDLGHAMFPAERVEYGPMIKYKNHLLGQAWGQFQKGRGPALRPLFERFIQEEAYWLDDYSLYMALKDTHPGKGWQDWPEALKQRRPEALKKARSDFTRTVGMHQFRQFLFFRQWQRLKAYANQKGIKIIGDIPIFVAGDSADVWANPQWFLLDKDRRPKVVAGVPPDYFSATGQLWGNPLYDWGAVQQSGFAWWIARFKATLKLVDIIRLDHFRGFESYWEVPAGSPNAIRGRWVKAPGKALLEALQTALDGLPIIAEDLGLITPEVDNLRKQFDLPGMRILQFAFGDTAENRYLPHNFEQNTVAYTGTHDNDTSVGWYRAAQEKERDYLRRYLARDGSDVAWDLIRTVWGSVAHYAITPLQDVLSLGSEARMNFPGRPQGNWAWRYQSHQLTHWILDRLADLTKMYGRT